MWRIFLIQHLNKKEIKEVQDDLMTGKTKMLYVAPETLTKQENLEFFQRPEDFIFCGG